MGLRGPKAGHYKHTPERRARIATRKKEMGHGLGDGVYRIPSRTSEYQRLWRRDNPERVKKWRGKDREAVFDHYGRVCACAGGVCGERRPEFLTIDHLTAEVVRRKDRRWREPLYPLLRRLKFPKGYQTLCWNCNAAKSLKGGCPHERELGNEEVAANWNAIR